MKSWINKSEDLREEEEIRIKINKKRKMIFLLKEYLMMERSLNLKKTI